MPHELTTKYIIAREPKNSCEKQNVLVFIELELKISQPPLNKTIKLSYFPPGGGDREQ